MKEKTEECKSKPMHAQLYCDLERSSVDKEKSLTGLCSSGLKGESESLIIEDQDQALNMCKHHRNIMKHLTINAKRCYKTEEQIKHIVAGCTTLKPLEYTNRHNKVTGYIQWTICKHTGLHITDKYYEHIPERVIYVNSTTIMWDVLIITH